MAILTIAPKSEFQTRCLTTRADMMLLGGAAGASKTTVCLLDALRHRKTDVKMLFLRRYSKDIMQPGGLWDEACKFFLPANAKTNILKRRFTFPGGATATFLHADRLEDVEQNYRGGQIDILYFDEVTEIDESVFWFLQSRNRATNSHGVKPYTMMTCNPEDNWVKRLVSPWLDPDGFPIPELVNKPGWMYKKGDTCHTFLNDKQAIDAGIDVNDCYSFVFLPGTLMDNPVLLDRDPDYLKRLNTLPEYRRKSMTDGCWNFPKDKSLFKTEYFVRYDANEMPTEWDNVIICADLAIKLHEKADFTVFGVYGLIKDQVYLIYLSRGKWTFEQQKLQLEQIINEYTFVEKIYVENAGHAEAFFQALKNELPIPIVLVSRGPLQGKYSRACATLPLVESKRVHIPHTHYGDEFITEMTKFTGDKKHAAHHDDMCDTFFDACRFLRKRVNIPQQLETTYHKTSTAFNRRF